MKKSSISLYELQTSAYKAGKTYYSAKAKCCRLLAAGGGSGSNLTLEQEINDIEEYLVSGQLYSGALSMLLFALEEKIEADDEETLHTVMQTTKLKKFVENGLAKFYELRAEKLQKYNLNSLGE